MSNTYYLNIGLAPSKHAPVGVPVQNPQEVVDTLRLVGFAVLSAEVQTSGTEETVVAVVQRHPRLFPNIHSVLESVCYVHAQDCIAAWSPDAELGELIGPRAADWGTFKREFFLFPKTSDIV
jgi:hypothetical protein